MAPSHGPSHLHNLKRLSWLAPTSRARMTSHRSLDSSFNDMKTALCSPNTSPTRSGTSFMMPKTLTDLASKRQFSLAARTLILRSEFMLEVQSRTMPLLLSSDQSFKIITTITCQEDTGVTWTSAS